MQLYHRTLLPSSTHFLSLSLHLFPIKPKQQHDKPRQLLLSTSSSLQLYKLHPNEGPSQQGQTSKYELRLLHTQPFFGSICAMEGIVYQDDDLKQEFVIVTLNNGKYQLLEWMPSKKMFSVRDQNLCFENSQQTNMTTGLVKPTVGHHIAVNNEAKLVLIASLTGQYKIYSRSIGIQGIRLSQSYERSNKQSLQSVCVQAVPGQGNNCLFYLLRTHIEDNHKVVRVVKIVRKGMEDFEEQIIPVEDSTVHMVMARSSDHHFFLLGQKHVHYINKGKLTQLKIPQPKPSLFVSCWRRPMREKRQEYFLLNTAGELIVINFDDSSPALPCSAHFIEPLVPSLAVSAMDRNTFFLLTCTNEYLLIEAIAKYKVEERHDKTRAMSKLKEEKEKEEVTSKGPFKEFDIVGTMNAGRVIRDMKICNVEKGLNNQILLTGGRPSNKKGFLSIIKYGLKMKSHLSVSCTAPSGIWALRRHPQDRNHTFVVLSFSNRKTMSFVHENSKLLPTTELRLDENEQTLHVTRMADGSLVQIVPSKMKVISRQGIVKDFSIRGRIMKATSVAEGRQILLSLVGGFMQYYELMGPGDIKKIKQINLDAQAHHIHFSPPEGIAEHKPFSKLIGIAQTNYHVQLYSVGNRGFELVSSKNLKVSIESLAFVSWPDDTLCLHVGSNFGKSYQWNVSKQGEHIELTDDIFGQRTIRYATLNVPSAPSASLRPSLLRTSPQPTLSYSWQNQLMSCSLPIPTIEHVENIWLEGIQSTLFITFYDNYLRFLEVYGFGNLLYTVEKEIDSTGRFIVMLEDEKLGVVTQSKINENQWHSRFLFTNPAKDYEIQKSIPFEANEKVLSVAAVVSKDEKNLVCFGCVTGHTNFPNPTNRFPSVKIYSYEKNQNELLVSHLFNFSLDHPPTAMEIYLGKLLIGVGSKLMLYDIYKQKLVLRATSDGLGSPIVQIQVFGQKIFISQALQSFSLMKINHKTKSFEAVGHDILDRFSTCSCLLDGQAGVIGGADKFGNLFISKVSQKMKTELEEEIKEIGTQFTFNIPNYMQSLVSYHMGEIVTAIQCGRIDPKKPQRIFYATIDGRVGTFYPLEGQQEQQLLSLRRLQEEMTKSSLCGASNQKVFRAMYNPTKGVVDGDFCQLFECLGQTQKTRLSGGMEKEPKDIRNLLAYIDTKF